MRIELDFLLEGLAAIETLGAGEHSEAIAGEIIDWGVPYRPSRWRGRQLSCAARKRYSVVAARMERAGLIKRIAALGGRVTHFTLQPAGIARAIAVARGQGAELDEGAIHEGAKLAGWIESAEPATFS